MSAPHARLVLAILCTGLPSPGEAYADPFGACGAPATRIHEIQGAGRSSPLLGRDGVVVEAVVVGAFPGFPDGIGGFFLQEEDADTDADPATSEGLFVFDDGLGSTLAVGDRARVRGKVGEFFGFTELSALTALTVCPPGGSASAAAVALPVDDAQDWERWEGMRVRIGQPLVATGHHALGRFGEVELAAGGRLWAPTHRALPGAPALAWAERNARHRILLDDGSDARDPRPVPHHAAHAARTLRLGDTLPALEGVVEFAFGRYRIHPTTPVRIDPLAARPEAPPDVGGTLRVVAWNVENFFNGDGRGGGFPTRGAADAAELTRQRDKLVASLARLAPDVAALIELENDGTGSDGALADLVRALDAQRPGDPYAAIELAEDALGTRHAISVGLIYRASRVTPRGAPAVLDGRVHADFDDRRSRPSLAQTFEAEATGAVFTVVANHLKSKGSSCAAVGDPDRGDGQGDCNATRTRAATALVEWLRGDPTGAGDAPVLIVGDLNAHPREDPVRAIRDAGFVDLVEWFAGPDAHTYVFSGAAGRLDHALASPALLPEVADAAVWHTNADEASLLDYELGNPPPLYARDPFRASDHDPLLLGLFPDADGDGVTDARDACDESAQRSTVVLGGCRTGVAERFDAEGCTLTDRLLALVSAEPGGAGRMREAAAWVAGRIDAGVLALRDRGRILACVARLAPARIDDGG